MKFIILLNCIIVYVFGLLIDITLDLVTILCMLVKDFVAEMYFDIDPLF